MSARSLIVWLALLGGCGDDDEGSPTATRAVVAKDPSDEVFAEDTFATFDLAMDPAEWESIVQDPHNDRWRRASMTWQGETVEDVGVRASGVTTRRPGDPNMDPGYDWAAHVARVEAAAGRWG